MNKDCKENKSCETLKTECSYGERCYRKHPAHFEEYEHQHLNELMKILEPTGLQVLPEDYKPKISRQTVIEQLNILKRLKSGTEKSKSKQEGNNVRLSSQTQETQPQNFSVASNSVQRKRQIVDENKHGSCSQVSKVHKHTSKKDDEVSHGPARINSLEKSDLNEKQHTATSSNSLSSEEYCKKMQGAQNLKEAMEYFQEVKKRSQGRILQKIDASTPYHFFLTSVTDSMQTHTESSSLQMFDILDPSLGELESSLQINFMVEFGWLMAQYHISKQGGKPITLLYKEVDANISGIKHVTAVKVECPSRFGSHHTKMCVMAYKDESVRVCVHTANLVESDWNNRVQGVWLSPACPTLSPDADSNAGESPTYFKRDIIQYLSAYRLPQLQPWISKLRRADFSHINVFFVASVPGSHKGVDANHWGHTKLGALLTQHAKIPTKSGSSPSNNWQVIAQCSSIGSLGPQPTSWFCGEIKQHMSKVASPKGLFAPPPIRLVYPSFNNVSTSYDGLLGGGCLPYSKKTHEKQPWLQEYLFQWKCELRHRTRAMPHIKTYCRVSPDLSQLAWFHLTSANLSKAAWGSQTKAGANNILSYEAGVLFLPKFVVGQCTFPLKKEIAENVPVFPMPYDLPLSQYSAGDIPWFIDVLC